jgi:hypothetical protein
MLEKIITNYSRFLRIFGSAFVLSFIAALAADTLLFNGLLGGVFEFIIALIFISGGLLAVGSLLYIVAISKKILTESFRLITRNELLLLLIALVVVCLASILFIDEFYYPF